MSGAMIDDDWDISEPSNEARTIVLVGRAGNGKSATGNSILGRKAFKSRSSSFGVTSTSEMQRAVLRDGQVMNVIDTPGLFDFAMEANTVAKEIINCVRLAKDGIHAFVFVFSARTRITKDEQVALQILQSFFGHKIVDYMIIVFTGGDDLDRNEQTLEDYIGHECPEAIQEILQLCKNRLVLFNNITDKESKNDEQVHQLLSLVNKVITENGGKPYTDEFFVKFKEEVSESSEGYSEQEISELKDNMPKSYEEQLKRITEMVEHRLGETIEWLEQCLKEEQAARLNAEKLAQERLEEEQAARLRAERLAQEQLAEGQAAWTKAEQFVQHRLKEEQAARRKAEESAEAAKKKFNSDIDELRKSLERARMDAEAKKGNCVIL